MIIPGVEFFVRKVWQGMQFEGKQLCTSAAQYRLQTLLQTSKRILDTAFISYKVQGYILTKLAKHGFPTLHTILGKTSYTLTKPAFVIPHTILAIHLHNSYVILMQHNTVYTG